MGPSPSNLRILLGTYSSEDCQWFQWNQIVLRNSDCHVLSHVHPFWAVKTSCCYLTDQAFPSDLYHFPSLMDLNLFRNKFASVPMSIHKPPKLRRLCLNHCPKLKSLPELPSSIGELEACNSSHVIGHFNPCQTIFNFFASPSKDRSQVLIIEFSSWVVSPSVVSKWASSLWFDLKDGKCISLPPHDCLCSWVEVLEGKERKGKV